MTCENSDGADAWESAVKSPVELPEQVRRNLRTHRRRYGPPTQRSAGKTLVLQARLVTVALAVEPGADASRYRHPVTSDWSASRVRNALCASYM